MNRVSAKGRKFKVQGYRGRVRSGCLTCRSRKIKCDELRPICNNCTKYEKRRCVYKPGRIRQAQSSAVASASASGDISDATVQVPGAGGPPPTSSISNIYSSLISKPQDSVLEETIRHGGASEISWGDEYNEIRIPESSILAYTASVGSSALCPSERFFMDEDTEFGVISPSTLISRDIKLTTTLDLLVAGEIPLQLSFSFFVEAVECPPITPYDSVNWQYMKLAVVELGMSNQAVASAIIAASALYKGQLYSLPLSRAVSLYQSSRIAYEKALEDETVEFGTILVATFLLCLSQFVHYEIVPILRQPSEKFLQRLRLWAQNTTSHSELSARIIIWLRILNITTTRGGGGIGLISDSLCSLFPCDKPELNIRAPSNHQSDTSTELFKMLSTPIFGFYFSLQIISGEIAKLSHYHRSRTTGQDQEEVVQQTTLIKSRLQALWESRSTTQTQSPHDLCAHLAPKIANPIISLIGICAAAYHAELVEIDRVLGDPVSESIESKQAMSRIRQIVDGDWNTSNGGKLNPGYIRPLFLYAIECMDRDENKWAVEKLRQIQSPICRSEFFASFGKALSDAQLRKERRVASKYFCIWYFGVPPPFM